MVTNGAFPAAAFGAAVEQMRAVTFRSELRVREIPAPEHLAPYAFALAAEVHGDEDDSPSDHGSGRIVLLHDPAAADVWESTFRIVCFAHAPLEVEIGLDPLLADVAWSWLVDALTARGAGFANAGGTATKLLSSGYGTLGKHGDGAQIEVRASWSPTDENFRAHAEGWGELLGHLAGLPAAEHGVAKLRGPRVQRG